MERIKVLFIDDERINLLAFKSSFRREFDVFTSISAVDAVPIMDNEDIHVVIADQRMPEKTGVDFFNELRIKHPLPTRILITAYSDYQAVVDSINKGHVYRFLKKPWDNIELKNAILEGYRIFKLKEENELLLRQYNQLFIKSPIPLMLVKQQNGRIHRLNSAFKNEFKIKEDFEYFKDLFNDDLFHSYLNSQKQKSSFITSIKKNSIVEKLSFHFETLFIKNEKYVLVKIENLNRVIVEEKERFNASNKIQNNERMNFSSMINNSILQDMVLLKMQIENAYDSKPELSKEILSQINKTLDQTRQLSYLICPPDLNNGLIDGIKAFIEKLNSLNNTSTHFKFNNEVNKAVEFDNIQSYNTFRIVQDLISDALNIKNKDIEIEVLIKTSEKKLIIQIIFGGLEDSFFNQIQETKKMLKNRAKVYELYFEINENSNGSLVCLISLDYLN